MHEVPHPGECLRAAAFVEPAGGASFFECRFQAVTQLFDALPGERARLRHMDVALSGRLRGIARRALDAQRVGNLNLRACCAGRIEIALVHDHEVGELHHATLERLQIIASVWKLQ
jgi:hypothetical protein